MTRQSVLCLSFKIVSSLVLLLHRWFCSLPVNQELGYEHQRTVMFGADQPAHVSMAGVHRVAALLQRWILGTHHGAVQPSHLDAYLDEFVFRFNRRSSTTSGDYCFTG